MATATSKLQIIIDVIGGDSKKVDNLGNSLTNLVGDVAEYKRRLDAVTPENLRFAQSFERIQADLKSGKISIDEARTAMDRLNDEMKETPETTAKASTSLSSLKSTFIAISLAVAAVGVAAKKAYKFISEGADIELAQIHFDRLATSIGTTGDALTRELGPAVDGLMSKAGTMQLAGDLMSLGLAKTSEQAVRLTAVASQLGMNMNQLVLTLTNQTTMRFDALGVAVDGFEEKVKNLEEQGYSTDEAFKWAFIEQAEAQLAKTGGVANTTAGELMKLEATYTNLIDAMKSDASKEVGKNISSINVLNELLKIGAISSNEYFINLMTVPEGGGQEWLDLYAERIAEINQLQERGYDISYRYGEAQGYVSNATWDNYHALNQSTSAMDFYARAGEDAARANTNYALTGTDAYERAEAFSAAMERNKLRAEELAPSLDIAGQSYSNISTDAWSATEAIRNQIEFLTAGGGAIMGMAAAANAAIDQGDFGLATKIAEEMVIATTDLDLEMGKIDATQAGIRLGEELGLGPDEAKARVALLQESLFKLTGGDYTVWVDVRGYSSVPGSTGTGTGTGQPKRSYTVPGLPPEDLDEGGSIGYSGASGGGGGMTVNILGPIYVDDGADFLSTIAAMAQRSSRNAAGVKAGSSYTGAQ